ncbi:MAG TPA: SpoIIE family protein phosphatase [Opitutaceae bacterium]|nr:SpoIIE family protein phosphatase [Opitutaceae bacterium]
MSHRETSLVWRLTALILGGAGLVLLAILAFSHFAQRRLILEQQLARSDALALAAANHIDAEISRAEVAVRSTATAWALGPNNRASVTALIEATLQAQPQLFGMAVAIPTTETSTDYRTLYGLRRNGAVQVTERNRPELDYIEDWFYLPYYLRRPVWSEPYYDPVAQARMITYAVPILQEGRVVAVITGDLPLAWLRQLIQHLPLDKGSSVVLLSTQGIFINHPDPKVEMRETVFSLAETLATPEAVAELKSLGWSMLRNEPGQRFYSRPLDGARAYINHRPVPSIGWAMGVIVPEDQMLAASRRQTEINLIVGATGLVLLLIAALIVAYSLASPLRRLAVAANQLATGQFDTPLPPVRRRDEVGRLTESFAAMRTELRDYIARLTSTTAAKEKIASELAIAHQIQLGIVPKLFPPFPQRQDLDLFACLEPAREVGGDLYDFALLDPDHLYVAIGDVSGKGVPASLLMAVGKTLLKSTIQAVRDPARALVMVNNELSEHNDTCMFITAFCGVLNLRTGDLTYANAGHNPPLILRASGSVDILRSKPGPALAAMPGSRYISQAVRLSGSDVLLLYTDGVTEAMNPANVMFDEPRLVDLAGRERTQRMKPLVEKIVAAVHTHADGAEQSDDITLLAMRVVNYPDAQSVTPTRAPDAELALKNRREDLTHLVGWLETIGERSGWPTPFVINLNLALEEWFVNVVSYAFTDSAEHPILFRLWHEGELLRLEIEDDGRPFDPTAQALADTTAGIDQRKIGGLGIHFIRRTMAGMTYRRQGDRNILTLTARLSAPDSHPLS